LKATADHKAVLSDRSRAGRFLTPVRSVGDEVAGLDMKQRPDFLWNRRLPLAGDFGDRSHGWCLPITILTFFIAGLPSGQAVRAVRANPDCCGPPLSPARTPHPSCHKKISGMAPSTPALLAKQGKRRHTMPGGVEKRRGPITSAEAADSGLTARDKLVCFVRLGRLHAKGCQGPQAIMAVLDK